MEKRNYPLKAALVALFSLVLVSCATVQTGMQNVQLGMTRQQVEERIGKNYQVVSMVQTDEGPLEILRYEDQAAEAGTFVTKGYYILHFLKGRLVESNYEDLNQRPQRPLPPVRPRH